MNAFQSLRPRGVMSEPVRPSLPRGRDPDIRLGNSPASLVGARVLDVNGRPMATLAPRQYGGGAVLSRAQSQAQNDKTRAIVRGGI